MPESTHPAARTPRRSKRPRWLIPVVGLAAVVLLAAGGLYWFFSSDAPAEVDLSATAEAVTGSTTTIDQAGSPTTTAAAVETGIAGTWTVDTTVGQFTITEATTATFAGFRVDEVLSGIGSTTAVGRTPNVTGTVVIEETRVASAEIVADLTRIVSDETRREGPIQRALGTAANPEATFVLAEPIELSQEAADGSVVSVTAVGDLTINGTTNRVEIPMEAQLVDGKVLIAASTGIVFADYGVTAPSAPIVVSVEDNGILELQVWLSR